MHLLGTDQVARAGDPGTVVDDTLGVHSMEGLRLVDDSVMPADLARRLPPGALGSPPAPASSCRAIKAANPGAQGRFDFEPRELHLPVGAITLAPGRPDGQVASPCPIPPSQMNEPKPAKSIPATLNKCQDW